MSGKKRCSECGMDSMDNSNCVTCLRDRIAELEKTLRMIVHNIICAGVRLKFLDEVKEAEAVLDRPTSPRP